MDFIAIDFETANTERCSACAVGFSFVKNGQLAGSESYLIKPSTDYFDPMNISIHGLTPDLVADSPTWPELWPDIKQYFNGTNMMAHNAGFDFSVFRQLCKYYSIEHPTFDYCCSLQIAKQTIPELSSYALNHLCEVLNIDLDHHDAESDANACSRLVLHCFDHKEVNKFSDISRCFDIDPGKIFPGGYKGSLKTYSNSHWHKHKVSDIEFDASNADPKGPMYGKMFVFTGTLESMTRIDAQRSVLERGGLCKDGGVTKTVAYLVLGEQDFSRFGEGHVSSKTKKAQKYAEEGTGIKIISEWDFLNMI